MCIDPSCKDILDMLERKIQQRIEQNKVVCTKSILKMHALIDEYVLKTCSKCKKEKPSKDFYKNRKVCKSCFKENYLKKKDKPTKPKKTEPKKTEPKKTKPVNKQKKHRKIKTALDKQKTEYNKLYEQISGIVDTYFGCNKYKVIKAGKKIFSINETINTKDHLIEEILPLCICNGKTIKKMRRFVELARTQVEKQN